MFNGEVNTSYEYPYLRKLKVIKYRLILCYSPFSNYMKVDYKYEKGT